MIWFLLAPVLVVLYVFGWSLLFVAGRADDDAMRQWDAEQDAWRDTLR